MEGLASRTVTGDFGQDARAARTSMLVLFEEEHPCAFGNHESVAVGREWPRSALRSMVPRRSHNLHEREALHDSRSDGRVNAADQHHGNKAELDLPQGVAERVRG